MLRRGTLELICLSPISPDRNRPLGLRNKKERSLLSALSVCVSDSAESVAVRRDRPPLVIGVVVVIGAATDVGSK